MTSITKIQSICICLLLVFFSGSVYAALLLPEGSQVQSVFFPGVGKPIGKVQLIQGTAYFMHGAILKAYHAKENLPIYAKDTLYVMEKSRISILLNDHSLHTFASNTKMSFNRMEYFPGNQYRSAHSMLHQGKGRFRVKNYKHFKQSSFSIKTPTALIGVRGSDFVIRAALNSTRVETLKKTRLSLLSLAEPDKLPILLDEFQWAIVEEGSLPSAVETLTPDQIESIINEFDFDQQNDYSVAESTVQTFQSDQVESTVSLDSTTEEFTEDKTEPVDEQSDQTTTENQKEDDQSQQSETDGTSEIDNTQETKDNQTSETDNDISTDDSSSDSGTNETKTTENTTSLETNINTFIPEVIPIPEDIDEERLPEPFDDSGTDDILSSEDEIIVEDDTTNTEIETDVITDKKETLMKMPWFPVRP